MSDELKKENEEVLQPEQNVQPEQEAQPETSEAPVVETPVVEEEKPLEAPAVEEEVKEETSAEELPKEEPKEEEEVKEEPKAEEEKKEVEEEAPKEEPEVVKEEVDIEAIKAELEDLKAEKAEAAEVEALGKENARVANEFSQLCQGIGKGLEEAFAKYAIPTDKTIEELEKEDPAKAQLAKNLTKQANDIIEAARKDAEIFLNEKAHEVVFKKADRLLQKMDVSDEEAPIVAETFLGIIAQSGIRDLHDDLKAKLELAVAKAKMVVNKVGKTAEVVKEVTDKVTEKIEKVEDIIVDKRGEEVHPKPQEEPKAAIEERKKEPPKPVEEINKTEFEEGVGSKSEPTSGLSLDNVVEKMLELPFKEQTKFYKEHYALIEEAMRRNAR